MTRLDGNALSRITMLTAIIHEIGERAEKARAAGDPIALVKIMDEIDTMNELVADVKAEGVKIYDRIRFSHLPDVMEEKELGTFVVEGIGQCYLTDDVQVSAKDKDALKEWLIENHLEDMITENVNAQTLAAFVRRRMKAGEDLPVDLLNVRPFTRAAIKSKTAKT